MTMENQPSLSPKLNAARARHHLKRRESIHKLELSKTALDRRSSGDDQTVDTVSTSSMMSSEPSVSSSPLHVTIRPVDEQLPFHEKLLAEDEATPVSSMDSQQGDGRLRRKGKKKLEVDLTLPNRQSQDLTAEQSQERAKANRSDPGLENICASLRLKELRKKHSKLRQESIYKLEISKSSMDSLSSSIGDGDETVNDASNSSFAVKLPQHEQLTLMEENEDLKEKLCVLVISEAVARKECREQTEIIRKLREDFHSAVANKAEIERDKQRLQEMALQRQELQKSVHNDQQRQTEKQTELEGLQEQLSKAQKQLDKANTELKLQEYQDWFLEWSCNTGLEAQHTSNLLGAMETLDPTLQKRRESWRDWLDRWALVAQNIQDLNKTQKQPRGVSVDTSAPPKSLKRQLSRSLGPNELSVIKEETAQVMTTLSKLRMRLDAAEDDDEIQEIDDQIDEQLRLWETLEEHMDELVRSDSSEEEDDEAEGKTPGNDSKSLSVKTALAESAEKLQRMLEEMLAMATNPNDSIHSETDNSKPPSSSWTPASILTLLLTTERQEVLVERIQDQTLQIQLLQQQEKQLKALLESAQEQIPKDEGKLLMEEVHQGRRGISNRLGMLERQVQQLQNENAALLSTVHEQNEQHEQASDWNTNQVKTEQQEQTLSNSTAQEENAPQLSRSSSDHIFKKTNEAERNKLAYDTAQAYFARKQEREQEVQDSPEQFELSVRQMDLSIRHVSPSYFKSSSRSPADETETASSTRQSRLLSRHIIGKSEPQKPLIFVDEAKIEKSQQEQQLALQTKLKSFLGISW
ncbi:MAG: hypothetical protein SGBAC_005976 [Bacillariaceae sp.]